MALRKTIIDSRGISSTYHKISSLEITDRITVTLKSYADETYRMREKTIADNIAMKESLQKQLIDETVKEESDEALIQSINSWIESLDTTQVDYSVGSMTYKLPFKVEDEISFRAIYETLKKEASFSDAEDC